METQETTGHWLLVIDHHEARIYRSEMHGAVPQTIRAHSPEDEFRHSRRANETSRGKERSQRGAYFEPVAKALHGAEQFLIFGTGTGMSSEMEQFVAWLKKHHPALEERVVGTVTVDEHHLTEGQLLAKAREFYESGDQNSWRKALMAPKAPAAR